MFNGFLAFLLFIASGFIILLVLVQRGKGGGLTGALGGMGGQSAFGAKAGDVFTKITVASAAIWIVLCLITIRAFSYVPVNKDNVGAYDGEGLFKAEGAVIGGSDPVELPSIGGTGDDSVEDDSEATKSDDASRADEKTDVEDAKSSLPPVPPTNPNEKSNAEEQDPKSDDSGESKTEATGQPENASEPEKSAEPASSGENQKTAEPEKSAEPKKNDDGK